jgi:hypothetical protein
MSKTPKTDIMLHGVLRMPTDMWSNDPLDIAQRHSRYLQASDLINKLERDKAALLDALKKLTVAAENIGGEHVTGWQSLLDACVTSEQVMLKVNEAKNG